MLARLPANTQIGMMEQFCNAMMDDGDTFYSQRVFDLFPQMATANSGWSTHGTETLSVFGSFIYSGATNNSDYIEWSVYLPAGSFKLLVLHKTATDFGKADLAVDGGSVVSTMDQYSGSPVRNALHTSTAFTVTEGLHTIRLTKNGKNASSSAYTLNAQHCQLIKQDTTSALTSVANCPHVINVPVVFADSHTGWNGLGINNLFHFGQYLVSNGAQNATITYSFWAPKGAFTLALDHSRDNSRGIYSVSVDGSSIGTIDGYGGATYGTIDTSLTGTLTSTGMHTITFTMATKNASSSGYGGVLLHIQIRMTSITEPLVQDLAPEVALLWPTFAESNSAWSSLTISSSAAYYYYLINASGAQNDEIILSSNIVLRPGTYRLDLLNWSGTNRGKCHLLLDGSDVGSVDCYQSPTTVNVIGTLTGITLSGSLPHTIKFKMVDKNASSSQYFCLLTLARLIRTGA